MITFKAFITESDNFSAMATVADRAAKDCRDEFKKSNRSIDLKDAEEYEKIAELIRAGKHGQAQQAYRRLDTAARDILTDKNKIPNDLRKAVADYFEFDWL